MRKPATFFGHKLVVIEEEYLTEFIGCCVNPGLGIVVEKNGSITKLAAFLSTNKCKWGSTANARSSMEFAGVKPKPGATYISISCRDSDLLA